MVCITEELTMTTALDHIKSGYWNATANKSINSSIRQNYFLERYQVRAM